MVIFRLTLGNGRIMTETKLPVGEPLHNWNPPSWPSDSPMVGTYCRLERLSSAVHGRELHEANSLDTTGESWTYLFAGPFESLDHYLEWLRSVEGERDPLFFAIVDLSTGKAVGLASYLRINPEDGVIEVGHIKLSPLAQRSRIGTEAMYPMMKRAFESGYRRYEWKCDSLNAPSRRAAERYGFTYEGSFRQAVVYKGRNRDTAWFSIIDKEWEAVRTAFERWLSPDNFEENGEQKVSLSSLTEKSRRGP